jgi:hypothetical protein
MRKKFCLFIIISKYARALQRENNNCVVDGTSAAAQ